MTYQRLLQSRLAQGLARRVRMLRRDEQGLSAIEFALLLPVMVFLYMGTVDASMMITADRKVSNVASSMGDLVSQATALNDDEIADIFAAAESIMDPLETGTLSMVITSVVADADNNTTVAWSDAFNGSGAEAGEDITVPEGLTEPLSSVIVATATYTFETPVSVFVTGGPIVLDETFYLRPRRRAEVLRIE